MLAKDACCVQAKAEELRQQVNPQDIARGIAQRAAQQGSGNAGAIQPRDAVAAAKAGKPLSHMPSCVYERVSHKLGGWLSLNSEE